MLHHSFFHPVRQRWLLMFLFAGTEAWHAYGWSLLIFLYQASADTPSSVSCRSPSTSHQVRGEKLTSSWSNHVLRSSLLTSMLSLILTLVTTCMCQNISSLILVRLHNTYSFSSFSMHTWPQAKSCRCPLFCYPSSLNRQPSRTAAYHSTHVHPFQSMPACMWLPWASTRRKASK
jgi:hypothetical protein